MRKKFVVIGCSNERFGDFVAEHWLKSLRDNVDLNTTEIVLLDYGLNNEQKKKIIAGGAKIVKCVMDGHIVNLRYRDLLNFLKKNKYEQAMMCDSGDIIFQKNIMEIFYKEPNSFKAVTEGVQPPTLEYSFARGTFSKKTKIEIIKTLRKKKMINGGVIAGPSTKVTSLCKNMLKMIQRMDSFGPDQIVLNFVLYKEGFFDLGENFNYIPVTAKKGCKIIKGVFYNKNGELVSIVHNAGNYDAFRIINNFGYGSNRNTNFNLFIYLLLRATYRIIGFYRYVKNLFY